MAEVCAIFKVLPWLDKSKPRPQPERLEDILLPERNISVVKTKRAGKDIQKEIAEKDAAYLGRVKQHVLQEIEKMGLEVRSTPSLVADRKVLAATLVAYVHAKGPKPSDIKRTPIARVGVATRRRPKR